MVGEKGRLPAVHLVTFLAAGGKAVLHMIGIGGFHILIPVAALAALACQRQVTLRQAAVAALAIHQGMPAEHGKIAARVNGFGVEKRPSLRLMAAGAIAAQPGAVHVIVAGETAIALAGKIGDIVTVPASQLLMVPFQRKIRALCMIENDFAKARRGMASFAIETELFVRILLCEAGCRSQTHCGGYSPDLCPFAWHKSPSSPQ